MRSASELYALIQAVSRVGMVNIETRLRLGCSTVRIPVGARDFPSLQVVSQSASGIRLACLSAGTSVMLEYKATHCILEPKLRMNGAKPLLLMAWMAISVLCLSSLKFVGLFFYLKLHNYRPSCHICTRDIVCRKRNRKISILCLPTVVYGI